MAGWGRRRNGLGEFNIYFTAALPWNAARALVVSPLAIPLSLFGQNGRDKARNLLPRSWQDLFSGRTTLKTNVERMWFDEVEDERGNKTKTKYYFSAADEVFTVFDTTWMAVHTGDVVQISFWPNSRNLAWIECLSCREYDTS